MTSFRARAAEVREAGEAERGNFTPSGAPKRLYDYWLNNSRATKAGLIRHGIRRENFCHYWRVVLIWAPLLGLWRGIEAAADKTGTKVLFGLVGLAATVYACVVYGSVLPVLGIILAGAVLLILQIFGGLSGYSLAQEKDSRYLRDLPDGGWLIAGMLLGVPTSLISFGLTKFGQWWGRNMRDHNGDVAIGAILLVPAGWLTYVFIAHGLVAGLLTAGGFVLFAVVVVAGIFAWSKLADYLSGKRALAKERWDKWLEEAEVPDKPARKPTWLERKLGAFFRGIGDFVIFMAQVVRVNKWKICPIVEVDTKE